jgi:hypothetical protein
MQHSQLACRQISGLKAHMRIAKHKRNSMSQQTVLEILYQYRIQLLKK